MPIFFIIIIALAIAASAFLKMHGLPTWASAATPCSIAVSLMAIVFITSNGPNLTVFLLAIMAGIPGMFAAAAINPDAFAPAASDDVDFFL